MFWSNKRQNPSDQSVCMISKISEVLLALCFLVMLVCFPLMQSTQISKSIKSRASRTPSFANLLILSIEIWHNLLCHNVEDFSFITPHLMSTFPCIVVRLWLKFGFKLSLNKPLSKIPSPTTTLSLSNEMKYQQI